MATLLLLAVLSIMVMLALLFLVWYPSLSRQARAEKLAIELLRELLPECELEELGRCGYLVVRSPSVPGRAYRIPARGGRVIAEEPGEPVMLICMESVEPLPRAEVILMHKLMIEGDEQEYLRLANIEKGSITRPRDPPARSGSLSGVANG
jgi:hypothetical protein